MVNKQKIVIGIPAFNEDKNIGKLLDYLCDSKNNNNQIDEIIVCSDASTDNTNNEVLKKRNVKTRLIINKERKGLAYSQNRIIQITDGDILILLNADIIIKNKNTVSKLIQPIVNHIADLTSCKLIGISNNSRIASLLNFSIDFKNKLYESYDNGQNIYTCHGAIRAFSKKLYKNLRFVESTGEDAYSYLYSIKNNYKYQYVKDATVAIISPDNMFDHTNQSSRFFHSEKLMESLFDKKFVKSKYKIPLKSMFTSLLYFFLRQPLKIIQYITLYIILKIRSTILPYKKSQIWTISSSSKYLKS